MKRRPLMLAVPLVVVLGGFLVVFSDVVPAGTWPWNRDAPDAATSGEPLPLEWADLVPADFEPPPNPFIDITPEQLAKLYDGSDESEAELDRIEAAMSYAPVDEGLDGRLVTIPGYIVPLDFDGQTRLEEFLLVPYFGACIHTPPPPANQIVMADLGRPTDVGDTYEPVLLRGVLRTEKATSDLAEAGYTMDVESILPYEP